MMKFHKLIAGFVFGVSSAASTAMAAAPTRIWVSGHGIDKSGCSTPANPCRTLQYAHDTIAAGGEIDILDPAGYGAVTITKAVSIINDGVGTAGVQATSGAAITINAGPNEDVILRGLNIEGLYAASTGIAFNGGAALTIVQCTIQHFIQNGVTLDPHSSQANTAYVVNIQHSTVNGNGQEGISGEADPGITMSVLIAHSDVSANGDSGISMASHGYEYGSMSIQVIDVTTYFNADHGIFSDGGGISISIGGSSMSDLPVAYFNALMYSYGDNYAPGAFGTTIAKH